MQLRMWMYDLAREQTPTLDHMRVFCDATLEGGYNAIGLYLEHRFAYPSTPWAYGRHAMTPDMIATLEVEYPQLQIIPFVNLLGHFEGMIYTEFGKRFREERFQGMQACPSKPEFVEFAKRIIDDTVSIFKSEIVHIGGDETWQLGKCPICAAKVKEAEAHGPADGKAVLYGQHFGPLAKYVAGKGRRPAVWGDMYLEHPTALDYMPKETLIFDWQYFSSPLETSRKFKDRGFEVVCCPTLQTYNAVWFHLHQSEENVRQAAKAAQDLDAFGVCVTTWECALMGNYETLLPAIKASGEILLSQVVDPPKDLPGPKAKSLVIEANDQISEADIAEHDASIGTGVTDSILMNALSGKCSYSLTHTDEQLDIRDFDTGTSHGSLPLDIATGVIRRLLLLANIDPIRKNRDPEGEIKGTYHGEPFRFQVTAIGDIKQPDLKLINPYARPSVFLMKFGADKDWANLMGAELQKAGGVFAFSQIRSSLKVRLLLEANPFLAWLYHHEELCGEVGDKALAILDQAISIAPNGACRGVSEFVRGSIEFVRYAEQSRQAYANALPGVATSALAPCRQLFENMEKTARATQLNIGGSLADIERCRIAKEHVERVIKRIKEYGDGSLGYLPAFEHITHPKFVPHDQGAWWLINKWANE
jgi:hypothetical protein